MITSSSRFFFCVLFLFCSPVSAQESRRGALLPMVDSIIAAMPAGIATNEYRVPTAQQRSDFSSAVSLALTMQFPSAAAKAASFGYRLIALTDTLPFGRLYYILLRQKDSLNHWGTFVFDAMPRRPSLVIQSPHELFDTKTGAQGAFVFRETGARAFFLNGTHRCNDTAASSCSGTTTACGANAPFRVSDQAHTVTGMFQAGTEAVLLNDPKTVVVQLHGFGKDAGDPDVIMGNGTASAPTGTDFLLQVRNALLVKDSTLTFKVAHVDTAWTTLTGTTNTQGKLVNGSAGPCSTKPSSANGRFLHIEQAYAKLRDTKANWQKMANALASVFPAVPDGVTGPSAVLPESPLLLESFPNPFNPSCTVAFRVPFMGAARVEVFDAIGRRVRMLFDGPVRAQDRYERTFDASSLGSGMYVIRLTAGDRSAVTRALLVR